MILSEILGYLATIQHLIDSEQGPTLSRKVDEIFSPVSVLIEAREPDVATSRELTQIKATLEGIRKLCSQSHQDLQGLATRLYDLAAAQQEKYVNQSQRLFVNQLQDNSTMAVASRIMPLDDTQRNHLQNKILRMSRWEETGLVMRPSYTPWLAELAAMDLVYFYDHSTELMQPALEQFAEHLRGKFRVYAGDDRRPFVEFPRGQFGYIVAYGFFNWKPLDVIYHYLWEFSSLMRPGGVVLFTFNDCDTATGARACENHYMCYAPGRLVRQRAVDLGFIVREHYTSDNGLAWLELERPGKFHRFKGAPIFTKIHARSK